jgi:hypothetical protein
VGAGRAQHFDHLVGALEQRTGERTLVLAVAQVRVGARGEQGGHRLGVAVVGGEHQQCVALVVRSVDRNSVCHEVEQLGGLTGSREVRGEREDPSGLVGGEAHMAIIPGPAGAPNPPDRVGP